MYMMIVIMATMICVHVFVAIRPIYTLYTYMPMHIYKYMYI